MAVADAKEPEKLWLCAPPPPVELVAFPPASFTRTVASPKLAGNVEPAAWLWLGICVVVNVVLPTVPLTEPDTEGVPKAVVNAADPPDPAVPDTTRNALLSCVVDLVQPVGAAVCTNIMAVPAGNDEPPPEPLEAAVTRPLASTVMFAVVYVPAVTPLFARVMAVATSPAPLTELEPVTSPVKLKVLAVVHAPAVVAVDALPDSAAVIVPALKLPDASRATMALAVLALVAVVSALGMEADAVNALVPLPLTYPVNVFAPVPPRATASVPEEMLDAFVVSVVAEAAKPETAAEEMAIAVLVTEVTCPCALVTNTGTEEAEPYVPAVPVFVMLNWVPLSVRPVPAE